jgi:hypothetical protein
MRRSIFLFFLVLYLATTAGHIYTIDSYLNYAVTKAIGSHHRLSIPRSMMTVEGRGGGHYSKLGIGQSIANLPGYWMGALVETLSPGPTAFRAYSKHVDIPHGERFIKAEPQTLVRVSEIDGARVFFTTVTNSFVVAAVCIVFFMLLGGFGVCAHKSFLGALLLGFATPFWVYSRDLFGEPLFALSLLGSFYFLASPGRPMTERRAMIAGAFSSVGILTRMSFAPIVAIFALYLVLSAGEKKEGLGLAVRYVILSLPGLVVVGALNWARFESVFVSGYHTAFDRGFSVPLLKGIAYNLVSPYRSIFLYAPPVALFFVGMVYFARKYRSRLLLILAITVYMFVLYSRWWAWHGGWCWGPRFYLPVIPLLMLPGLVYIRLANKRRLWPVVALLGVAGLVVQLGAVFINYTAAYDYWIKIEKLDWAEAGIHMFSPITTHWKAILATSPGQYDIWLIQATREAGPAVVAVAAALGLVACVLAVRIWKMITRARPDDCVG